jgi:predicted RNA-binding protein YlxR (DUF448 family)
LRLAVTERRSEDERPPSRRIAVADRAGTMPGRGAYLCRGGSADAVAPVDQECLERASRRGGIARALRAAVTLDPKLVESPVGGAAACGREGLTPQCFTEQS